MLDVRPPLGVARPPVQRALVYRLGRQAILRLHRAATNEVVVIALMSAKDESPVTYPQSVVLELRDRLTVDLTHIVGRLERLEDIAVLLAVEASRGTGQMGQPFYDFIDAIRAERKTWPS